MFLRANLLGVLELLQDADDSSHLSEEVVAALGFILSVSHNSKPCALLDLAVSAAPHSGYSKVSGTLTFFRDGQKKLWGLL